MSIRGGQKTGFILPTVVILSLGMLIFLGTSFSTILTTRKTLYEMYYYDLARSAAQSGVVKAEACLLASAGETSWDGSGFLVPGDQCVGLSEDSITCDNEDQCWEVNQNVRMTFKVETSEERVGLVCPKFLIVTGITELFGDNQQTIKNYKYYLRANLNESCQVEQVF